MEHISRVVRSVLARIASSGTIRLSAGEGCYGPATAISAAEEKEKKMPRLIDANELKEWVENWLVMNAYYHPYSKSNNIPIPELYDILGRMPTVDVEPVKGEFKDEILADKG